METNHLLKTVALSLLSFIGSISIAYSQQPLIANAGKDSVLCNVNIINHDIQIGGDPTGEGGFGNLFYHWDIFPKPYIPYSNLPQYKVWASDMLSDTTISNPLILPSLPENVDGPIGFVLTVIDDSANVVSDTVKYWWINWNVSSVNDISVVNPGDTQTSRQMDLKEEFRPIHSIGERHQI